MRVVLFSIGKFHVYTYGLMIAVGVILAIFMAVSRAPRKGLEKDSMLNISIVALVFGLLGAKIFYVLENFRQFLKTPLKVFGSSGFVVYGGIIIAIAVLIFYTRKKKYHFFRYFDLTMPSISLAQAFGRLGCFGAGCCYGKETASHFHVIFTESPYAPNGIPLVPTQLISSAGNFAIMAVLLLYSRKAAKVGDVGAMYVLLYGIGRFLIEFLRENEQGAVGPFTTAQAISLVFVAISILLFIRNRKSKNAEDYIKGA